MPSSIRRRSNDYSERKYIDGVTPSVEAPISPNVKPRAKDIVYTQLNIGKPRVLWFDSDTVMLTDNKILLDAANRNYDTYPVPTKIVDAKKINRIYTPESLCDMDIATSVNKIGEIINLSQELNTLMWDKINRGAKPSSIMQLYCDISQLDVMSNIEIDSAKKEYPVDNTRELSELKTKYMRRDKKGRRILPNFFAPVSRKKGYYSPSKKAYVPHKSTMDFLQKAIRQLMPVKVSGKVEFLPFAEVLKPEQIDLSYCKYEQIERVLNIVRTTKDDIDSIWKDTANLDIGQKYSMTDELRQRSVDYVEKISFSRTTMYRLLLLLDDDAHKAIARTLFLILFGAPNISFFQVIDDSRQPRDVLVEDRNGDIRIHDFRFSKQRIQQQISDFIQF